MVLDSHTIEQVCEPTASCACRLYTRLKTAAAKLGQNFFISTRSCYRSFKQDIESYAVLLCACADPSSLSVVVCPVRLSVSLGIMARGLMFVLGLGYLQGP